MLAEAKRASSELLVRDERRVGKCHWKLEEKTHVIKESLVTLLFAMLWKTENVSNESNDLTKEVSWKNIKNATLLCLSSYYKIQTHNLSSSDI
jgi:hypothetical protein